MGAGLWGQDGTVFCSRKTPDNDVHPKGAGLPDPEPGLLWSRYGCRPWHIECERELVSANRPASVPLRPPALDARHDLHRVTLHDASYRSHQRAVRYFHVIDEGGG